MAAKEFNPIDNAREPREKGWEEETEKIIEHVRKRGDQRIGQLLVNAVSQEIESLDRPEREKDIEDMTDAEAAEYIQKLEHHRAKEKAQVEQKLWGIEADKLAELLGQGKKQ